MTVKKLILYSLAIFIVVMTLVMAIIGLMVSYSVYDPCIGWDGVVVVSDKFYEIHKDIKESCNSL